MKKKFIILTITGLLLASLAACGGSKTPDASKNTADQEAQNQNQDSQGTSDTIQGDIEENHGYGRQQRQCRKCKRKPKW